MDFRWIFVLIHFIIGCASYKEKLHISLVLNSALIVRLILEIIVDGSQ